METYFINAIIARAESRVASSFRHRASILPVKSPRKVREKEEPASPAEGANNRSLLYVLLSSRLVRVLL